jgi:hypothetical protein
MTAEALLACLLAAPFLLVFLTYLSPAVGLLVLLAAAILGGLAGMLIWVVGLRRCRRTEQPAPDLNRSSNVLERLCAAIIECSVETVAHIFMLAVRYANTSRCRDLLKPGGTVAEDIVAVDDDVPDVDADAEGNAPILCYPDGTIGHRRLHYDGAAHRIDHARKLQQQAVAGGLDGATTVAGSRRVDHLLPNGFQPACRSRPVPSAGSSLRCQPTRRRQGGAARSFG